MRTASLGAVAVIALGAMAPNASAFVFMGNVMTASLYNTSTTCSNSSGCVIVQDAVGDPATVTRAPFRGVILNWCVRGKGMFQVFAGTYVAKNTLVRQPGSAIQQATSADATACSATRLAVQAHQVLGLILHPSASVAMQNPAPAGTDGDAWAPAPPNGVPTPAGGGGVDAPLRIAYEAYVEPDADGDLYGDDTEDSCPTNSGMHSACPTAAAPPAMPAPAAPAPARDTTAPAFVSKPSVRPRVYRAGHRARIIVRASEAARLTIALQRRRDGRYRRVAHIVRRVQAGINEIRLPRSVAGHALRRGRYLAILRMVDAAGNRCAPVHAHFHVR